MSLLVFTKPFWLYSKKKSFSASSSFFSSRRQRRSSLVSWSFVMTRLWRRLSTALWTNSTRGWAPAISWPSFRYWKPARYSDCRHMCYHEEQYCEILWAFLLCKLHKWESSLLDSTKTELVAVFPYKAKKQEDSMLWDDYQEIQRKHAVTLWLLVHTDYIYLCVCVCLQSENGSDSVYSLKFTTWKSECTADSSKPWTDCDYLQSGSKVTIIGSSSHLTTRGMKILKFLLNALVKTKPSHGLSCPSRGRFLATPPSSCQRQRLRQSRWTARLVSEGE